METRRRLTTILAALLFSMLLVGSIFAQDDAGGPPAPDTVQTMPSAPPPGSAPPDSEPQTNGAPSDQAGQPGQTNTDPPGRVARIEYMSGEVSMQPGGVNDWVAANQNRPLTTSDRVWTDKNSKTELSVGDAFFRMNSETSVTLSNVSDNTVQLELDQGTLELTVRHLEPGEVFEVDAPNAAFTVTKAGVYRFDVFPNEDKTWITVRKGQGEATGKGSAVKINSGQQVRFSNGTSLIHTAEAAPSNDGFDDWAKVRDERLEHSESARYVSPGVIGAQDLDQYGRWQQTPQYGAIWVPTSVPVGWAPYRYGHWAWIDPWGWTWVDDAAWGFAPFHYGRWVSYGGYWGWAPGPIGYWRPYYAPALVGWIGGPGFGIGFGGAGFSVGINFGWFALGFGEPFYPWYGGWGWGHGGWYRAGYGYGGYCSRGYFNRVNVTNTHITNITNITNNYYSNNINNTHYANRGINGAVTAAPKSAFTSGAAINRAGVAVPKSGLQNARMLRTASVSPTRAAVLGGNAPSSHVPPSSAVNRSVVRNNTPPARPNGFGSTASTTAGRTNPSGNLGATHAPTSQSAQGARPAEPATAAHNVPRPPSAGGTANPASGQANVNGQAHNDQVARASAPSTATHNVPRPPASNDSFARGNGTNVASHAPASEATRPVASTNNGTNANQAAHNVPRPPANYSYSQPSHAGTAASPSQSGRPTTYQSAPSQQQQHQSAPAQHSSAPATHEASPSQHQSSPSHESGQSKSDHPGSASMPVPRPPTGYSYHAAPTYSASSTYGSNRIGNASSGSSYGRSSSSYANASSYGRGSSSYGASNPSSRSAGYSGSGYSAANRGYSAPSSNAGRSYSAAPSYSARSAAPSSYSAPRSYGSSGGGHYSGGGSSHASSGSGGHTGGGGGGGHHGR